MLNKKMMKPAEYAEHLLLTSILNGELKPGEALPGERKLAEQLGITRPTLRETLQRMAREGWFKICHGKATIVNDYMAEGGMGLLSTLVKYGEFLPERFIEHFLNMRCMFLPFLARKTIIHNGEPLQRYLENCVGVNETAEAFMEYDWELQRLMASLSGNPLYRMILNDFNELYRTMGLAYFKFENARTSSLEYYQRLLTAVTKRDADAVEQEVRIVMDEALEIWTALSGLKTNEEKKVK